MLNHAQVRNLMITLASKLLFAIFIFYKMGFLVYQIIKY
jgi:hypothetical protein